MTPDTFGRLRDLVDFAESVKPKAGTPDRIRITQYVPPGMFVLAPYEHDDSMPGPERTVSDDGPHEILCHPDDWAKLRESVGTRDPHDLTAFFGLRVVGETTPRELADSECGHSQLPPTESEIAGSPEVITRRCAVCDRELWWQLDQWRKFGDAPSFPRTRQKVAGQEDDLP